MVARSVRRVDMTKHLSRPKQRGYFNDQVQAQGCRSEPDEHLRDDQQPTTHTILLMNSSTSVMPTPAHTTGVYGDTKRRLDPLSSLRNLQRTMELIAPRDDVNVRRARHPVGLPSAGQRWCHNEFMCHFIL